MDNEKTIRDFRDSLMGILYLGNGIGDLLKLAEKYLGPAVFLYDINYNMIGASPLASEHQEHIRKTTQKKYLIDTEVDRMKKHSVLEDLSRHEGAFVAEDKDFPGLSWLLCAIRIKGAFIGYVISPWTLPISGHTETISAIPFKEIASQSEMLNSRDLDHCIQVMTELSYALSIELQKGDLFSYKTGIKYSYFLNNLINGEFENDEVIHSRMEILNRPFYRYHHMICISSGTELHPSIVKQCREIFEGAISSVYSGNLVLLTSSNKPQQQTAVCYDELSRVLETHRLYAGVSQEYTHLSGTSDAYLSSLSALRTGMRMNRDKRLFFAEDMLFYHILNFANKASVKNSIYRPYQLIKEYDTENGTEYLATLETYFLCGRSSGDTAKKMHLHRSSLFYRFKTIEEKWGISLSDPETLFSLEMSFRIDRFLSRSE